MMEKKNTIIALIFVGVIIVSAVILIITLGITAREYNYVQLEINPKVEFIVDKDFKVVSYRPLNEDAKVLLSNENYKGLDIDDVAVHFIDLAAQTGYIDVDGFDNAVNITVIDGLTQALDVHITEKIYSYLRDNEILCAVVENSEDRKSFDSKKEEGLCCANKYKLISTLASQDSTLDANSLKDLSEIELIDMVTNIHQTNKYTVSSELREKKELLLSANKAKYDKHKKAITNSSQSSFSEVFDDYQKSTGSKYHRDFEQEYINWQKQYIL